MSGELRGGSTSFDAAEGRRRWRWRHSIWIVALVTIVAGWMLAGTARADVAAINLSVSPTSIPADGTTQAQATATVTGDTAGPTAGLTVTFGFTGTAVTPTASSCVTVATTGNDSACPVTITGKTIGTAQITAQVTGTTTGTFTSTAQTLTLTAGPAATIAVVLNPTSIVANGTATTIATATVKDAQGNLLPSETVAFSSTNAGQTPSATANAGSGTYTATITSTTTVGTATITATDGTVTGTATLTQAAAVVTVTLSPTAVVANGTDTTTATATVKDAQGNLLATETTVVFSSSAGNTVSATANAGSGTYTATITSTTTVGTATIIATDGAGSGSAALTQTVGAAAFVTVTLSPAVIVANGTDTTTATATVTDAVGHALAAETKVAFSSSDKGQFFGQVTNNGNGTYTVQIRGSTTVGRATITVTDGAATGPPAILDQAAGPSSTSVVAVPATPVTNQGVSLFAAVSATTGSPSGTITFESGGAPIAGCVGLLIGPLTNSATCQTSFTASTSPRHLTAVFTPDTFSTVTGSTGAVDVAVGPDSTSVALTGPAIATPGQGVTYSATVSPPAGRLGTVPPSGTIQFLDDGQPIPFCAAQPLVGGSAHCTTTYTSSGKHNITARYTGDQNFMAATSSTEVVSVVAPPAPVLGTVTALTQWSFYYTPSYTKVLVLMVKGASIKASIVVKCHGRGCPYASRTLKVPQVKRCGPHGKAICPTGNVNVGRTLTNRHLSVGAVITVIVSRPQWNAKYYAFTVRAGKGPQTLKSCLAPDGTKPGVGCSP